MVHYIANVALLFNYRQAAFSSNGNTAMLIMGVGENHILPRREKQQKEPGVNDISFIFFHTSN